MRAHLIEVANRIRLGMPEAGIPCDGVNYFINDGKAANQTVAHMHLHVLPRRRGDGLSVLRSFSARWLKMAMGRPQERATLEAQASALGGVLERDDGP